MPVHCVDILRLFVSSWKDKQGADGLWVLGLDLLTYRQGSYDPFLQMLEMKL